MLTAAHVIFEYNNDTSNPAVVTYVDELNRYDYRNYLTAYSAEAIANPTALPEAIEPKLTSLDLILIEYGIPSDTVTSYDPGLVVFLDQSDLLATDFSLSAGSTLTRYGEKTIANGTVVSLRTGGFEFSGTSINGDSGGPYILETDFGSGAQQFVVGTQSAKFTGSGHSIGTSFTYNEWASINLVLGDAQSGDVTNTEPTNLLVGSAQFDSIIGSFRADILLGRGGDDSISDGDDRLDFVWADDTLVGGAGNDSFSAGAGDDVMWGGDQDSEAGRSDGIDRVSYLSALSGIQVTISGSSTPVVTVNNDGSGQSSTDTLYSIEVIEGSESADTLTIQSLTSQIATAFDFIDLGGSEEDTIDLSALNGSVTVNLSNLQSQTVTLGSAVLNLRNVEQVIGSGHDDTITGPSGGTATTILAGGGNDTIRVAGVGHTVDGGTGEDTLELIAVTGSRVDGDGHSVVGTDGSFGYSAIETVRGGSGNDRMYGGDTGHYIAGSGISYLEGSGADAILESTSGDTYFAVSNGATVISGAGNDYIDVSGSGPVTIKFGVGSGHDMIDSYFNGFENGETRLDMIVFEGLTKDDIELVWDFTEDSYVHTYYWDQDGDSIPDDPYPQDWLGRYGEAAIRIKSTGETLYLGVVYYDHEDYYADYELFVGDLWNTNIDAHNIRAAYNIANEVGPEPGSGGWWDQWSSSAEDPYGGSVDADIFSFDGVTRLSFFDLFDFRNAISQPLPAEAMAAEDVLSQLAAGAGGGVVGGTAGNDSLNGTTASDDILAGDGNDTINGGGGSDLIRGGGGADIIVSGPGNDSVSGGSGRDTLDYSSAGARVTVNLARTTAQSTGAAGIDTISEIEDLIGSAFNDVLAGNSQDNKIVGGAGNDTLDGSAGKDVLDGGADRDIVSYASASAGVVVNLSSSGPQNTGGGGVDTLISIENIVGSNYDDTLIGSDEGNNIKGGGGNDTIRGSGLNDVLEGGEGNDTINGEAGFDVVSYSTASAGVTVSLAISTAQDTVGAGVDTITGLERLTGSAHSDVLGGSLEANIIAGGVGDDRINGAYGNDTLTGDAGADTFIFDAVLSASGNVDKITDFVSGLDTIELDQSIFLALGGLGDLTSSQFHVGTSASDVDDRIIYDQATGNIYYDADGSGAGAQMLFAQVTAGLTLASTDFSVV